MSNSVVGGKMLVQWSYWPSLTDEETRDMEWIYLKELGKPVEDQLVVNSLSKAVEVANNLKQKYGNDLIYVDVVIPIV